MLFYDGSCAHMLCLNGKSRAELPSTSEAHLSTTKSDGMCFFALNAQGHVTAFRADIGSDGLAILRANRARLQQATTTEEQYQQALTSFAAHPDPAGILLQWVCRENVASVDLTTNRMTLTPV